MAVPDLRTNSYYMSKFSGPNQVNVRRNYEEIAGSYGQQANIGDHCFTNQQRLYYRQPYSMTMVSQNSSSSSTLNSPLHFLPGQHLVQEPILPKFPPQMFDIPDIQDSNSVFNEGTFDMNNDPTKLHLAPALFEAPTPPICRTLMPFPGDWQPRFISTAATGSTNSSPHTHSEENNSYDISLPQPLTTQQQNLRFNVFSTSSVSKPSVKKAKSPKKRKRKDPNEPQKPVSAYSLFFRNAQAAIKSQNPSATFGDISKIVASMWDNLDNEIKRFYKRQMEAAKKEYLKQLAVYRANLALQETEGPLTGHKDEADQSQQTSAAKLSSSSSSSSSSSLLANQTTDESTQHSKPLADLVPEHQSQAPRPSSASIEAAALHKSSIVSQHGMNLLQQQQQQQSPTAYFQEQLIPASGSHRLQNSIYGQPDVPQIRRNIFHSYNKKSEYFGTGGLTQNIYPDRIYTSAAAASAMLGHWNHSLRNDDYTPMHENFHNSHNRDVAAGICGLSELNEVHSVKWT